MNLNGLYVSFLWGDAMGLFLFIAFGNSFVMDGDYSRISNKGYFS